MLKRPGSGCGCRREDGTGGPRALFLIGRLAQLPCHVCLQGARDGLVRSGRLSGLLVEGQRLREEQTPMELDMEEGDVIDVMVEQMGD